MENYLPLPDLPRAIITDTHSLKAIGEDESQRNVGKV
jgi:hypothetical protein